MERIELSLGFFQRIKERIKNIFIFKQHRNTVKKKVWADIFPEEVRRWKKTRKRLSSNAKIILLIVFLPIVIILLNYSILFRKDIFKLESVFNLLGIQVTIILAYSVFLFTFIEVLKDQEILSFVKSKLYQDTLIVYGIIFSFESLFIFILDTIFLNAHFFHNSYLGLCFILMTVLFFLLSAFIIFRQFFNEKIRFNAYKTHLNIVVKDYTKQKGLTIHGDSLLHKMGLISFNISDKTKMKSADSFNFSVPNEKAIVDLNLDNILDFKEKNPEFTLFINVGEQMLSNTSGFTCESISATDIQLIKESIILAKDEDFEKEIMEIISELLQGVNKCYIHSQFEKLKLLFKRFNYTIQQLNQNATLCLISLGSTRVEAVLQIELRKIIHNVVNMPLSIIDDFLWDLGDLTKNCLLPFSPDLLNLFLEAFFYCKQEVLKKIDSSTERQQALRKFSLLMRDSVVIPLRVLIDASRVEIRIGEIIASSIKMKSEILLINLFQLSLFEFQYYRNEMNQLISWIAIEGNVLRDDGFIFDLLILETGNIINGGATRKKTVGTLVKELTVPNTLQILKEYLLGFRNMNFRIYDILEPIRRIRGMTYLSNEDYYVSIAYLVWGACINHSKFKDLQKYLLETFSDEKPRGFEKIVTDLRKVDTEAKKVYLLLKDLNISIDSPKEVIDQLERFLVIHEEVKEILYSNYLDRLMNLKIYDEKVVYIEKTIKTLLEENYKSSTPDSGKLLKLVKIQQSHHVPIEFLLNTPEKNFILSDNITCEFAIHVQNEIYRKLKKEGIITKEMTWNELISTIEKEKRSFIIFDGKNALLKRRKLPRDLRDRILIRKVQKDADDIVLSIPFENRPILSDFNCHSLEDRVRTEKDVLITLLIKVSINIDQNSWYRLID